MFIHAGMKLRGCVYKHIRTGPVRSGPVRTIRWSSVEYLKELHQVNLDPKYRFRDNRMF